MKSALAVYRSKPSRNLSAYRHLNRFKSRQASSALSSGVRKVLEQYNVVTVGNEIVAVFNKLSSFSLRQKAKNFAGIERRRIARLRATRARSEVRTMNLSNRGGPVASGGWRGSLDMAAAAGTAFSNEASAEACRWVDSHLAESLVFVKDPGIHGRVRWLVLEILAKQPTDALRDTLNTLLATSDLDPWLLNGVPTVIRFIPMLTFRERTRAALAEWLHRARQAPEKFSDHVTSCALGELIQTFGSFAEPSDVALLGSFVVGAWPLKPSVNAYDALARTARRHCQSVEVEAFFQDQQKTLFHRGESLAEVRHLSVDAGALLFSWIELLVARLGEEGQMAVDLALSGSDMLRRRTEKAIEDATVALQRRNVPAWFGPASARAAHWLKVLSGH